MLKPLVSAATILIASAVPAFAHLDPAEHGSFMAGASHPLFGVDHILAMVAIGLWAALLGTNDRRTLWLVPAAFVGTMLAGFLAAAAGSPLPLVEPVILASVVVIGLLAAAAFAVPIAAAMTLAGIFAFFHGHAHGVEMGAASPFAYGAGFALSTALLHIAGVAIGMAPVRLHGQAGRSISRIAGAATAFGGIWLSLAG